MRARITGYGLLIASCVILICPPVCAAAGAAAVLGENTVRDDAVRDAVRIDERLGEFIPRGLVFRDEQGAEVRLGDIVTRPTVINLVYFQCRDICPLLLSGIADVLGKTDLAPGKDLDVITVSFDPEDTPEVAAEAKRNYMEAVGRPIPEDAWRFLTAGEAESRALAELADALGFRFRKTGGGYAHPAALMVVAPDGKIVRYLYGVSFLPFDLKMAVAEAEAGRVGATARRVLLYCFSYDAEGRRYAFNILRVVGAAMLACAVALFFYLRASGRKRRRELGPDE